MILGIRGYKIRCYAKHGNVKQYVRLYESYTDKRLAKLEKESNNEPRV